MSKIDKEFLFFCGKGGVGKTTCSAATAVKLAKSGNKTLLFSTDPAHSLSDSLNFRLTNNVTAVEHIPNLFAIEIDAQTEVNAFIKKYQNEINNFFLHNTYMESADINELLTLTIPGLDELMAIKKIGDFVGGQNGFTHYVCDTAPTGHALRLISMPLVLNEWIKAIANIQWKYRQLTNRFSPKSVKDESLLIILKEIVSSVKSIFSNKFPSYFNIVTIPEAMAKHETKRLIRSLNNLNISVGKLIINNVVPHNDQCHFCSNIRRSQEIHIQELKNTFVNLEVVTVPKFSTEINGFDLLLKFAESLPDFSELRGHINK